MDAPPIELVAPGRRRVIVVPRSADDHLGDLAAALGLDPDQPLAVDGRPVGRHDTLARAGLVRGSRVAPLPAATAEPVAIRRRHRRHGRRRGRPGCRARRRRSPPAGTSCGRSPARRCTSPTSRSSRTTPCSTCPSGGDVVLTQLTGRVPCRVAGEPVAGPTPVGRRRRRDAGRQPPARRPGRRPVARRRRPGAVGRRPVAARRAPPAPGLPALGAATRSGPAGGPAVAATAGGRTGGRRLHAGRIRRRGRSCCARPCSSCSVPSGCSPRSACGSPAGSGPAVKDAAPGPAASARSPSSPPPWPASGPSAGAIRSPPCRSSPRRSPRRPSTRGDLWCRRASHGDAFAVSLGWGPVTWAPELADHAGPLPPEVLPLVETAARFDDAPVAVELGARRRARRDGADGPPARCAPSSSQLAVWVGPADWRLVVVADDPGAWDWCRWLPHAVHGDASLVVAADRARPAGGDPERARRRVRAPRRRGHRPARPAGPTHRSAAPVPRDGRLDRRRRRGAARRERAGAVRSVVEIGSLGGARWRPDTSVPTRGERVHVAGLAEPRRGRASPAPSPRLTDPEDPAAAANGLPSRGDARLAVGRPRRHRHRRSHRHRRRLALGRARSGARRRHRAHRRRRRRDRSGARRPARARRRHDRLGQERAAAHARRVARRTVQPGPHDVRARRLQGRGHVRRLRRPAAHGRRGHRPRRPPGRAGPREPRRRDPPPGATAAGGRAPTTSPTTAPYPAARRCRGWSSSSTSSPRWPTSCPTSCRRSSASPGAAGSMGVHLVLATQRPEGKVNDDIRGNTGLRMALRLPHAGDARGRGRTTTCRRGSPAARRDG